MSLACLTSKKTLSEVLQLRHLKVEIINIQKILIPSLFLSKEKIELKVFKNLLNLGYDFIVSLSWK